MRVARPLTVLTLLAAFTAPASAQNFKFLSGNPYSNPTLKVGSYNYYVSPYRGQFLAVPGQPVVDIFCVDFEREVSVGQTWTANFTSLDGSSMANTYGMRFRGWSESIALERYKGAAFLASQFTMANKTSWPNLQAAIWSLMGENSAGTATSFPLGLPDGTTSGLSLSAESYFNGAIAGGATVNGSQWTVISDVRGSSSATQEFLTRSVVPEPESIILLASGLLALGALAYFRGLTA